MYRVSQRPVHIVRVESGTFVRFAGSIRLSRYFSARLIQKLRNRGIGLRANGKWPNGNFSAPPSVRLKRKFALWSVEVAPLNRRLRAQGLSFAPNCVLRDKVPANNNTCPPPICTTPSCLAWIFLGSTSHSSSFPSFSRFDWRYNFVGKNFFYFYATTRRRQVESMVLDSGDSIASYVGKCTCDLRLRVEVSNVG